jgi:hypothetical protein
MAAIVAPTKKETITSSSVHIDKGSETHRKVAHLHEEAARHHHDAARHLVDGDADKADQSAKLAKEKFDQTAEIHREMVKDHESKN